ERLLGGVEHGYEIHLVEQDACLLAVIARDTEPLPKLDRNRFRKAQQLAELRQAPQIFAIAKFDTRLRSMVLVIPARRAAAESIGSRRRSSHVRRPEFSDVPPCSAAQTFCSSFRAQSRAGANAASRCGQTRCNPEGCHQQTPRTRANLGRCRSALCLRLPTR